MDKGKSEGERVDRLHVTVGGGLVDEVSRLCKYGE